MNNDPTRDFFFQYDNGHCCVVDPSSCDLWIRDHFRPVRAAVLVGVWHVRR
jgi:hypothetical protein